MVQSSHRVVCNRIAAGNLGRLGGWAVDTERNQVYWSEEIFNILEWPTSVSPSLEQAFNLYPPEYRTIIRNAITNCAQAGIPLDVQLGNYIFISITDTGVGIAPAHLERVFEPFFTTKEKGKGTGLGLSMAYGFVKQSNGHIDICSELEQSTTVNLYLPKYSNAQNEIAKVEGMTHPVGTGECILLVEDDDLVRSYVHQQLEQLGYQVIVKSSGPDALEVIRQNEKIDLLFTDVVMPGGMSGRELGDAARRLRPNLKILYTSGYSEDAIVHQGRLDPGVKLLSKPYRRVELAEKLREVLDQEEV